MKCPTENCDETIKPGSKRLYCQNCRATMGRWAKRKVADIKERAYNLQKWKDRMLNIKQRKEDR